MAAQPDNSDRLVNVEIALAHLQQDYESLNEVVIDQARKIERLQLAIAKLTERLEQAEETTEPRDAQSEKPPHY